MVRAKKSLGQNFLRDDVFISRIIESLNLNSTDTVVEIGPGLGALTDELLKRAGNVIAIEFDRDMVTHLDERLGKRPNFELHNRDALTIDLAELIPDGTAKLVANLPYNISTPILRRLAEQRNLFSTLVLMFQREVVERIAAEPGSRDRGFLSVIIEDAFKVTTLFDVPPTAFSPVPKVWSSVIRLEPIESAVRDHEEFRTLISTAFAQKRKTLINNLKGRYSDAAAALAAAEIDPGCRAETLTRKDWVRLSEALSGSD